MKKKNLTRDILQLVEYKVKYKKWDKIYLFGIIHLQKLQALFLFSYFLSYKHIQLL